MKSNNPFSITFGKEPNNVIPRDNELREVISSFENNNSPSDTFIITGPRGFGKTVALSLISDYFRKKNNWIVIDLNPNSELLEQLASKLFDEGKLKKLFLRVEFNFSFKGIGFTLTGQEPILNVSTLLKRELEYLKKKNINVLIAIDEVVANEFTKPFFLEYQILLRDKFNISLLMTGLFQNINALQTNKTLSFLCRAPKIVLGKLNPITIANVYSKILNITSEKSIELAKLTRGYPFSFQLIGSLFYELDKKVSNEELIKTYDEILAERVYNLMYSEFSFKEKTILKYVVLDYSNEKLMNANNISKSELSNYKNKLYLKGIIEKDYRTKVTFTLPRFKEYLIFAFKYYDD